MPTYHYKCKSCSHEFEIDQKMSDKALKKCPECKKHTLHKVIYAAGLSFKGHGFHCTDYKSTRS